jgi:hypothetical protein
MAAYCRAHRRIIEDDAGLVSPGVERLMATPAESQQQLSLELNTVLVGGDGDTLGDLANEPANGLREELLHLHGPG